MTTANWVKNLLEEQGLVYEELHHPEAYTAQALAQKEHITGHRVAKVVVAMADDRPVELILPASRHVLLDQVRNILGAEQIRLANEEELEKYFPDCEVGAIPALRHWPGVEILMDPSMRVAGDIVFQGGTHRDAIRLRFDQWFHVVNPRVAHFSQMESGTPGFPEDRDW